MRCMFGFGAIVFAGAVATPLVADEINLAELTFSPWTKLCAGETCFIGRDGRMNVVGADGHSKVDCGPVVAATLIERNGDGKKTLRVTLPTRVSLDRGVRITLDQGRVIERPYVGCFANGCMADYDAGPELVDQIKQGRTLSLEATDKDGSPIKLALPLIDFANGYDGPPQETKVFETVFPSKEEMQASAEREKKAEESPQSLVPGTTSPLMALFGSAAMSAFRSLSGVNRIGRGGPIW